MTLATNRFEGAISSVSEFAPELTAADVYDITTLYAAVPCATLDALKSLKRSIDRSKCSRAMFLVVEALYSAFTADVPRAIRLLRHVLRSPSLTDAERPFVADLTITFLISCCRYEEARVLLSSVRYGDSSALWSPLTASQAILAAQRGEHEESRRLCEDAQRALDTTDPLTTGKVLVRIALAAFHRREYDLALDTSLQSIQIHSSLGAYWSAAVCYGIAICVAQDWVTDIELTRQYAEQMLDYAERSGHQAMIRHALIVLYEITSKLGDDQCHISIRNKLLAMPTGQQYNESLALAVSESIGLAWRNDFSAAWGVLQSVPDALIRDDSERATRDALSSAIAFARNDFAAARRLSRVAISRSAKAEPGELLCDRSSRENARLIAASVCYFLGDTVRAQRALSRRFDPYGAFRKNLRRHGIIEHSLPTMFRGYAKFLNHAAAASDMNKPTSALSRAERTVLQALAEGGTLAQVAAGLAKSRKTVGHQVESIYSKLGVRSRVEAVQRARQFGII